MIDAKDWPLEVQDHVCLDQEISIPVRFNNAIHLVIPAGTHGIVKQADKHGHVMVEFGGQLFHFTLPAHDLSLVRRAHNSNRRAEHDARNGSISV